MRAVTIGVYGFGAETFLDALREAEVSALFDVRQRRGVRGPEYARRYTAEILDRAGLWDLLAEMPSDSVSALLCVERDPEACHRSLIAERLAVEHGASVTHLRP